MGSDDLNINKCYSQRLFNSAILFVYLSVPNPTDLNISLILKEIVNFLLILFDFSNSNSVGRIRIWLGLSTVMWIRIDRIDPDPQNLTNPDPGQ